MQSARGEVTPTIVEISPAPSSFFSHWYKCEQTQILYTWIDVRISMEELERIAGLLKKRNQIDREISNIIGRPATKGHMGEFLASKIFEIELEKSAATKGIDGVFATGPLKGKTVNIKLYGKQERMLDIAVPELADYYLVLTGPKSAAATSRGRMRPLVISNVYLFGMETLVRSLRKRGVKLGIATSVAKSYWTEAEIYPYNRNKKLELTEDQRRLLQLFSGK
jgi:hypothetical protein